MKLLCLDVTPSRAGEACACVVLVTSHPAFGQADTTGSDRSRPTEVVVRGQKGDAQRLRESAEAVTVVETQDSRRESADMGDVLSRTQGLSLARTGGLGADARFSLNGLGDEQVRFFLDGIPLELAGFAFGVATVPVSLVDRVEVYRGVVPIRFGADALGGAVNLVTPAKYYDTGAAGSLQNGSFATYRATLGGRYRDDSSGAFAGVQTFLDTTKNNYHVDVQVPDLTGRLHDATVSRFHDAYDSRGAILDVGVLDRPWADKLLLRVSYSSYEKELQNNVIMTLPYGAVHYGESLLGITLRYQHAWTNALDTDLVAGVSRRTTDFVDTSADVYNWFGAVIYERLRGGEISGVPRDITLRQDGFFARANLAWKIAPNQSLRVTTAPTEVTSRGTTHVSLMASSRDPLASPRDLLKWVTGTEYELNLFADRLQQIVFAKDYLYRAHADALLTGGALTPLDSDRQFLGFGDAVRLRLTDWLDAKASYEYAARVPEASEVFGNGILVEPNAKLVPERSHNGNLGLGLHTRMANLGAWRGELNAFVRSSENLIVLLPNNYAFTYQNVFDARARGAEGSLGWLSPGRYVALESSVTYQDIRNDSREGPYADYYGNRLPNMPWLFASGSARLGLGSLLTSGDRASVTWFTRYVHEFFRTWESIGALQYKQVVDAQVVHSLAFTYVIHGATTTSSTFEVQNLTDARVYDVYGVQKPGRALFVKTTLEY